MIYSLHLKTIRLASYYFPYGAMRNTFSQTSIVQPNISEKNLFEDWFLLRAPEPGLRAAPSFALQRFQHNNIMV